MTDEEELKKLFIVLAIICFIGTAFAETDYAAERLRMVREELIARDIKDERVLDVMSFVERQRFVPGEIKEPETWAQPYSAALTAQLLQLKGGEKILEVGTGSGYQTAILAELAKEVYTIEAQEALKIEAERRFEALGYNNIRIKTGASDGGWPEYAPFDRVVINYPILYIPQKLVDQLGVGGKLLIHIGERDSVKSLLVEKQADAKLKKCDFKGTFFGPIIGEKPKDGVVQDRGIAENKKWKTEDGGKWKVKQR